MKTLALGMLFVVLVESVLLFEANVAMDKTDIYTQESVKQAYNTACLSNSNKHFSECEADANDYVADFIKNNN